MSQGHAITAGEDDPVVASFDVYCAGSLQDALHVFQFPLRPADRPYECSSAFMFSTSGESMQGSGAKPPQMGNGKGVLGSQSRLTLHYLFDTFSHSQHFAKAEPLSSAGTIDGSVASLRQFKSQSERAIIKKEDSRDLSFDEGAASAAFSATGETHRYHYALQSDPAPLRSDYVVGIFKDGALHVTPVASVRQFTPIVGGGSIRADARRGASSRSLVGSLTVEDEHSSRKPDDALTSGPIADIMLRQLRRQRSFAINLDAKSEQVIEYFPHESVESQTVSARLVSTTFAAASGLSSAATSGKFPLDWYFPVDRTSTQLGDGSGGVATKRKDLVWKFAHETNLAATVKDVMQSCQVIGLESLQRLVSAARMAATQNAPGSLVPLSNLLEALRPSAMQIHGSWVAKTSDTFRGQAAAMREVILLLFHRSEDGTVRRNEINALICGRRGPVSSVISAIKEILQSIADVTANSPAGERVWRLRELPGDGSSATLAKYKREFEASYPSDAAFQAQFWAKRSQAILSHVASLEIGKPCRQLFLTLATSAPGQSGTAASSAQPSAATDSLSNDPTVTRVREFVRRLFVEHGVVNKQRAKELIAKEREMSFPSATNAMLSFAVQEEVQPFTAATWILKSLRDTETDKYRPHLVASVQELENFESRVAIAKTVEKMNQRALDAGIVAHVQVQTIPPSIAQRVLSEVATYHQGEKLWHIKSGNI